jgi:hypothetical protein
MNIRGRKFLKFIAPFSSQLSAPIVNRSSQYLQRSDQLQKLLFHNKTQIVIGQNISSCGENPLRGGYPDVRTYAKQIEMLV